MFKHPKISSKFLKTEKSRKKTRCAKNTYIFDCLSVCWLFCWCFSSGDEFNSVYVLTGNNLWLFRLDWSVCVICLMLLLFDGDKFVCSSFIYKTLSELCRFGVLTRELCTMSCDAEPVNKNPNKYWIYSLRRMQELSIAFQKKTPKVMLHSWISTSYITQ